MKDYTDIKQRLRGSITPVVTPFKQNYDIDFEKQSELIEFQLDNGTHAISVTGTSGEPSSLTIEERVQVMENAMRTIHAGCHLLQELSTNHDETMYLTRRAEEMGADAAMVIVPYYNKPNQHALYKHFKTVADSVSIPIIIYNIPGRTAVNMEVDTMARLVQDCPNIIGAKESNKDFEHVNRVLQRCGRDFLLFSGIELLCYPMLAIGGAGSISATANVLPSKVAEMHDAWQEGDLKRAQDLHFELMQLNDVLFKDTNPAPVKAALGMMGKIEPVLRLPMDLPTEALQKEIRETLELYGIATQRA
ncbi:LOW QUALITY PROTEIN: dihydrodipicolinate synthase [Geomicrobium sp. JCM 19055]|nr:LOW QUALITY PROTEIN: dihydrodipicolinate synthase [Geomicrobium sp. JCM 19055]